MGKYEREANRLSEKVRYYYEHAGSTGYEQATPYFVKLKALLPKAVRSEKESHDAVVIRDCLASSERHMEEMRNRSS